MPFYWSQRPNLKYKPKPIISKTTNHVRAGIFMSPCAFLNNDGYENLMLTNSELFLKMDGFQRHFDSQILIYGKQTILNLVRTTVPKLYSLLLNRQI